jgi:hypothetical protein
MQDGTYRYDVFISYRWISPDLEWVRNQLDPALRNAGLRVCLDIRDFDPGKEKLLEMQRGALESRRTLSVIGPEYFQEGRLVEFESLMARRRDPAGRNSLLIPLIVRETEIPEWMRGLIPAIWTDPNEHQREWKRLLQVLGAPHLDAQPPGSIQADLQTPFVGRSWRARNQKLLITVAAAVVILSFSVAAIMQGLSGKSENINLNPVASPAPSPQPTITPSPSATPTPKPTVRSAPTRAPKPQPQRAPETPCSTKDRLIGKC